MKKKYITSWSLYNLMTGSSEQIVKLQMIWAGFSTAIASSTFALSTSNKTLLVTMGCMIIDKVLIGGLSIEERIDTNA